MKHKNFSQVILIVAVTLISYTAFAQSSSFHTNIVPAHDGDLKLTTNGKSLTKSLLRRIVNGRMQKSHIGIMKANWISGLLRMELKTFPRIKMFVAMFQSKDLLQSSLTVISPHRQAAYSS